MKNLRKKEISVYSYSIIPIYGVIQGHEMEDGELFKNLYGDMKDMLED